MLAKVDDSFDSRYESFDNSLLEDEKANPGNLLKTDQSKFASTLEDSVGEIPEDLEVTEELVQKLRDIKK